jgi:bacillithiol system protein YtxJ
MLSFANQLSSLMSDTPFRSLADDDDWADARAQSEEQPVLLFKHSSACPVSAKANGEMKELAADAPLPVYKLVVQDSRALSDEIAETLDVRHETPQAIVLNDRTATFDASHFDVTVDTLRDAAPSAVSSE